MANQALTIDQLSQSVADSVAARLGLKSSSKISDSLSALVDIKGLLGKMIDPNKSVQADQKFPFVFGKTFDNVLKELKETKKISTKSDSSTFFDAIAKIPSKIEEKIANKAKDIAYSFVPKSISSKVLSFTDTEKKPVAEVKAIEAKPVAEVKAVEAKPVAEVKAVEAKPAAETSLVKNLPNIIANAFKLTKVPEAPVSELEKKEEPKPILFAGFTPEGLKTLTKELPDIIQTGITNALAKINNSKKEEKQTQGGGGFPGLGLLKGALSALAGIGGLLLLLDGMRTSEWYKGLEKIAGKGLLQMSGFTKAIDKFIGKFVSKLIKIPTRLISNFSKSILGFFGKEVGGLALKTGLGASKEFIPKLIGGALKFIKKVPFVGSLISIGFAWDRFNKGDYVGGGLDVLSGVANVFGIAPLGWAIDGLNAFLDYKAGGIGKNKKGKGAMIGEWVSKFGSRIGDKIVDLPIIGPAIKAVQSLFDGNLDEALDYLDFLPGIRMLKNFLSTDTGKSITSATMDISSKAANMFSGMKDSILSKVLEYIPETIWGYPLRAKVAELFGVGPKANIPDVKPGTPASTESQVPPVKQVGDAQVKPDGGLVVSSPTEGSLFQISKNDGIVAAPMSEDKGTQTRSGESLSFGKTESILEKIANNTGTTNQNITSLITGFNNLARALEKSIGEGMKIPTVVNNVIGNQSQPQKPTSTQYANMGNADITNFRTGIVEASRFQPA